MREVVNGKDKQWELISKISEGDAGEIYRVKAVGKDLTAILKRPTTSPFDAERQLDQLKSEKEILDALEGEYQKEKATIKPVKLLDHGDSDHFFIVMEKATGFSLSALYKISKNEISTDDLLGYSQVEQHFAGYIAKAKKVPQYLILRVLLELLSFLDGVHSLRNLRNDNSGVVWNDVKPDHIFWNPISQQITIIDWGNAQFLNQGGVAKSGNLDANADLFQYVDAMGKYAKMVSPELARRLGWATASTPKNTMQVVSFLRKSILGELRDYERQSQKYRSREREICQPPASFALLPELVDVHEHILQLGECPDYKESRKYSSQLINQLSRQQDFEDCKAVLDSKILFYEDILQQQIVEELIFNIIPQRPIYFSKAIELAVNEFASPQDWEDVFWNIHLMFIDDVSALRSKNRLLKALAAKLNKQVESVLESVLYNKLVELKGKLEGKKRKSRTDKLSKTIKELDSVIDEWKLQEAKEGKVLSFNIGYDAVKEFVVVLTNLGENDCVKDVNEIPKYVSELEKNNVELIRSAWEKKDFLKARKELRTLHKGDPERLRVFTADRLLARASIWITETRSNPSAALLLLDEGKEFRYFFGKATWLDDEIRHLEAILMPRPIWGGKPRSERVEIPAPSPITTLATTANSPGVNDTAGTHPSVRKSGKKVKPPVIHPSISEATPQIFFSLLKECKWEDAKKMLEKGYFQRSETENYFAIVEVFQKIDAYQDFVIDWYDLIGILEKNASPESFSKEIAYSWEVIEDSQKKDWKNAKLTHSKAFYKNKINDAIDVLLEFSETKWMDKLSQAQIKKINALITDLESPSQSVTENVLSPYLISVGAKADEYIGHTKQALDEFNGYKTEKTSFNLLIAIKNLESHFIVEPEKPKKWLREYEDIVNHKKSIKVDEENPVLDFLMHRKQPSNWWLGELLKGFLIAVGVVALVAGFVLLPVFIDADDGFFWDNGRFSPIESNSPLPSRTPKIEALDTPELNPPVGVSTPLPVITFTPNASQFPFGCEEAKLYVKEKRWVEYLEALDSLSDGEYENLRGECGWSQDYSQRKLDVALRNIQSLFAEQIPGAKAKLVESIEQIGWEQTAKYIDESSDVDLLSRSQRLRWILASCNSAPVRIPVDNTDRLIKELTENYFKPKMKDVFKELCRQDSSAFLQTTILPQDASAEGNVDLLSVAPPYDSNIQPCFYNDQSDSKGIHYKGSEKDCRISTIDKKVDFIDFSMCIIEPKQPSEDTFIYGMSFLQAEKKYTLSFENKNKESSVSTWTEPGIVTFDPENTFDTSQIGCDKKNLDVQAIVIGNLLMWRYRSGGQFVYVKEAQVLDDEFIKESFNISLFGYVKDDPKELHFYLKKFDVKQGAP